MYPGATKPFNTKDKQNVSQRATHLLRQLDYGGTILYIV
jgi:hypothetical protein